MRTVYVHPSALLLAGGGATSPAGDVPRAAVEPGAAVALRRLADVGLVTVVVADEAAVLPDDVAGLHRVARLPDPLVAGDWFLTGEPGPGDDRPRGGTTVLVGPRPAAGRVPLPRFDMTARDMAAAVMEILAREAMG